VSNWRQVETGRKYNPFYQLVPQTINDELGGTMREFILAELDKFTGWAVDEGRVALQCPKGRAILDARQEGIVIVDFVRDHAGTSSSRYRFWMNKSSMSDLSARLRKASKDSEIKFDSIFETKIRTRWV